MTPLLRLDAHPVTAPHLWTALGSAGGDLTVIVNIGGGPGTGRDPSYTSATGRLRAAGITLLGYVDLNVGIRPAAAVLADVDRWAGYPVHGVFLDHCPVSPFLIGPAAVAVHAAQRAGLTRTVLNPGAPPDHTYRELGAVVCSYEGTWQHYLGWDTTGAQPGDGHLVYAVPRGELELAGHTVADRGAGLGLVTDLTPPVAYEALPAWLHRVRV